MKRIGWWMLLAVLLVPAQAHAATATATIEPTTEGSDVFGWATFEDTDKGLKIEVEVFGVSPGLHGIHVHEKGDCGDAGNGAGGHYNPDGVKHGFAANDGFTGAHPGDLGNIDVGPDGDGFLELVVPNLTVTGGKYNVSGLAVVLHEKQDDFGQPTGNAGGRIGCGIVTAEA